MGFLREVTIITCSRRSENHWDPGGAGVSPLFDCYPFRSVFNLMFLCTFSSAAAIHQLGIVREMDWTVRSRLSKRDSRQNKPLNRDGACEL